MTMDPDNKKTPVRRRKDNENVLPYELITLLTDITRILYALDKNHETISEAECHEKIRQELTPALEHLDAYTKQNMRGNAQEVGLGKYMLKLFESEWLLNFIDGYYAEGTGVMKPRFDFSADVLVELGDIHRRDGNPDMHLWMLHFLTNAISQEGALLFGAPDAPQTWHMDDLLPKDSAADDVYRVWLAKDPKSGADRYTGMLIGQAFVLRSGTHLDESLEEMHRAMNVFAELNDVWALECPPIARKYDLLRRSMPAMRRLLTEYFHSDTR